MENVTRKYSETQSVINFIVENKLNPRSLGIVVNKPKEGISTSAWFVLLFSKQVSEDLIKALGGDREKAEQLTDRQEVRVVGQQLLPRLKPLLSDEEGNTLYNKLTNYLDNDLLTEEETKKVLNAFISLIKAGDLVVSTMSALDEDGEYMSTKKVAHLRSTGISASSTIEW